MTRRRTDAFRNARAGETNTQYGTSCEIQVRSGVNAGTGGQGTLLAQLTGNVTAFGSATNGVLTSNAITQDSSADATGAAGHYQINTSASVFLESGLINGGDGVTIDNTSITAGQIVQMSGNWVITEALDDGV
jgi:hypothetical protein